MQKTILLLVMLLSGVAGYGQISIEPDTSVSQSSSGTAARKEWLPPFDAVVVDAPVDVVFVCVPESEVPQIVYDTKGSYTSKFTAGVRDRVLYIKERSDPRRIGRTTVEVRYNDLRSLTLSGAAASFVGVLAAPMLDLTVGDRASLAVQIEADDLEMKLSGEGSATLSGEVRYLTLEASAGQVEARGLTAVSVCVVAQAKARVSVTATERLEAHVTTGASVRYGGAPAIVRTSKKFMAGEVAPIG